MMKLSILFLYRNKVSSTGNVAEIDIIGTCGDCDVLGFNGANLCPVVCSIPFAVCRTEAPVGIPSMVGTELQLGVSGEGVLNIPVVLVAVNSGEINIVIPVSTNTNQ